MSDFDPRICSACLNHDLWFQSGDRVQGKCDSCSASGTVVIVGSLRGPFRTGLEKFRPIAISGKSKSRSFSRIQDIMRYDFGIMAPVLDDQLIKFAAFLTDSSPETVNDYRWRLISPNGKIDSSDESAWSMFRSNILNGNRYFDVSELFIPSRGEENSPMQDALSFVEIDRERGYEIFRARSMQKPVTVVMKSDLKEPPGYLAGENRLNPAGISHFYGSSRFNTAIAESRSEVGDCVYVGKFEVSDTLKMVNLSSLNHPFPVDEAFEYNRIRSLRFLRRVKLSLEEPAPQSLKHEVYLPTQYFAEFVKHLGYSGIMWRSVQGDGDNVVLFSSDGLSLRAVSACGIQSVDIKSTTLGDIRIGDA